MNADDPRHGTMNGYSNLKCRCPECTTAWAAYHAAWMNADPERLAKHAARERWRRSRIRVAAQRSVKP